MYAQVSVKSNILLRNGAYGIVMRGVQQCTCAGASLRGKNSVPLCCIIYRTATEPLVSQELFDRANERAFTHIPKKNARCGGSDCLSCARTAAGGWPTAGI